MALGAGERVGAVDVHRAGAADAFAAGAAEGQRRVDLVLDLDQRVENHRAEILNVRVFFAPAIAGHSLPRPILEFCGSVSSTMRAWAPSVLKLAAI
jgi:hypothetical protein